jgi:hypothetical protein
VSSVKPWRERFWLSPKQPLDEAFRSATLEILDLYTRPLEPYERVLSLDEKTSLQARTRTEFIELLEKIDREAPEHSATPKQRFRSRPSVVRQLVQAVAARRVRRRLEPVSGDGADVGFLRELLDVIALTAGSDVADHVLGAARGPAFPLVAEGDDGPIPIPLDGGYFAIHVIPL